MNELPADLLAFIESRTWSLVRDPERGGWWVGDRTTSDWAPTLREALLKTEKAFQHNHRAIMGSGEKLRVDVDAAERGAAALAELEKP